MHSRDPSTPRRSCTRCVATPIPLGDVGPITFLLSLVEVGIEVDHVLLEEAFAEGAGLELLRGVAALEFEILLLADVSPDLC